MARLAAAVLLLSLLAVASCRALEAEPDAYEGDDSAVVAISDAANGAAVVPQGQAAPAAEAIPAVAAGGEGFLTRLLSDGHRRLHHRRPCRHGFLHRHFLWARLHGLSGRRGVHPDPAELGNKGEERRELDQEEELKHVAEPDPDSRRPADTDGEQEVVEEMKAVAEPDPDSRAEQESEAVKAWKGEMVRRFRHGLRFHHHGHYEQVEENVDQERAAGGMKGFHHHHHEEEEKEEEATRKRFFHHHHGDSENEADEVEELAMRLSRAILRRSFHGRRHHHHHHAEEGGVKKWFKGLVNRF